VASVSETLNNYNY